MRKLVTAAYRRLPRWRRRLPCRRAGEKIYDVCWSHYTGWEPWAYADEKGLLKKWGDKYGITIRLTLVNDYVESVNLYTAGKYQACAMTNMDVAHDTRQSAAWTARRSSSAISRTATTAS